MDKYKFICDKLGGRMPTFEGSEDRENEYERIDELFRDNFDNVTCRRNGDLFFWSGIVEDTDDEAGKNIFLDVYSGKPIEFDPNLWPGPAGKDIRCTIVRGREHLAKEKCESTVPCGVCQFDDPGRKLVLKGLCFDELQKDGDFDTEYYVSGLKNERIYFRLLVQAFVTPST